MICPHSRSLARLDQHDEVSSPSPGSTTATRPGNCVPPADVERPFDRIAATSHSLAGGSRDTTAASLAGARRRPRRSERWTCARPPPPSPTAAGGTRASISRVQLPVPGNSSEQPPCPLSSKPRARVEARGSARAQNFDAVNAPLVGGNAFALSPRLRFGRLSVPSWTGPTTSGSASLLQSSPRCGLRDRVKSPRHAIRPRSSSLPAISGTRAVTSNEDSWRAASRPTGNKRATCRLICHLAHLVISSVYSPTHLSPFDGFQRTSSVDAIFGLEHAPGERQAAPPPCRGPPPRAGRRRVSSMVHFDVLFARLLAAAPEVLRVAQQRRDLVRSGGVLAKTQCVAWACAASLSTPSHPDAKRCSYATLRSGLTRPLVQATAP